MVPGRPLVTVYFVGTGTSHGVWASGGPKDGSLNNMVTFCGITLMPAFLYEETTDGQITCKRCLRRRTLP